VPDWVQRLVAAIALVLLSPVLATIAGVVWLDSRGPVLFGATRVGRWGRTFTAWKIRTMSWQPNGEGLPISVAGDPRVTHFGSFLRRARLDELPQLWNVVRGDMRFVGPRPEDPRFVDQEDIRQRTVLAERPGITGLAQLAFADEARFLGLDDPEGTYRSVIQPRKLLVDLAYIQHRSTAVDLWIIAATVRVIFGRGTPAGKIDRLVRNADWRLPERAARRKPPTT
jgi:lipopolysaccharide/colanic/teichoic acid biosynthesis glycosyltransferase